MKSLRSLKRHLLLPFGISVAAGIFVCAAALLLNSLIMWLFQFPVEWGGILGLLSLSLGSLAAGYVLGRQKKREGIKQGLLCGGGLLLISLLLGFVFGQVSLGGILAKAAVSLIAGAAGGVWGVNAE